MAAPSNTAAPVSGCGGATKLLVGKENKAGKSQVHQQMPSSIINDHPDQQMEDDEQVPVDENDQNISGIPNQEDDMLNSE